MSMARRSRQNREKWHSREIISHEAAARPPRSSSMMKREAARERRRCSSIGAARAAASMRASVKIDGNQAMPPPMIAQPLLLHIYPVCKEAKCNGQAWSRNKGNRRALKIMVPRVGSPHGFLRHGKRQACNIMTRWWATTIIKLDCRPRESSNAWGDTLKWDNSVHPQMK